MQARKQLQNFNLLSCDWVARKILSNQSTSLVVTRPLIGQLKGCCPIKRQVRENFVFYRLEYCDALLTTKVKHFYKVSVFFHNCSYVHTKLNLKIVSLVVVRIMTGCSHCVEYILYCCRIIV